MANGSFMGKLAMFTLEERSVDGSHRNLHVFGR